MYGAARAVAVAAACLIAFTGKAWGRGQIPPPPQFIGGNAGDWLGSGPLTGFLDPIGPGFGNPVGGHEGYQWEPGAGGGLLGGGGGGGGCNGSCYSSTMAGGCKGGCDCALFTVITEEVGNGKCIVRKGAGARGESCYNVGDYCSFDVGGS